MKRRYAKFCIIMALVPWGLLFAIGMALLVRLRG